MELPISTDSLLFNDIFLRSILLIPLSLAIYVLITLYKQQKNKFKYVSLIKQDNTNNKTPIAESNDQS